MNNEKRSVNVLVISNILCITDICNSVYGKLTMEPEQLSFYCVRYEEYYEKAIDFSNIDVAVIWLNFESLYPDAVVNYKSNIVDGNIIQTTVTEKVKKLYDNIKRKWNGMILVIGLEDYCYHITRIIGTVPIMNACIDRINISIMDFVDKDDYFIDLKRMISEVGYSDSYNIAWKYRWNAPYSLELYQRVWDEVRNRYCALYKKNKKCIILDCDNVLWGGTLVEDGMEKILLGGDSGREFQDFQRYILYLYYLGLCLCVCSKNSEEDVRRVFQKHSGMILNEEHIECFQVNWGSKAEGIMNIERQLNIGLDSMVFIDDSMNEINEVRALLPEVDCIKFNKRNIYSDLSIKLSDSVSSMDVRMRHDTYRYRALRENVLTTCNTVDEYAERLETVLTIVDSERVEFSRIVELLARVNKKTNGCRLTKSELIKIFDNDSFRQFSVHVRDRFSNLGLVGYLCIVDNTIISFALSCRAMGRGIEQKMIQFAKREGATSFIYFDTGKNEEIFAMMRNSNLFFEREKSKDYYLS